MNAILSLVVCASFLICAPFSPRHIDLEPCSSIDEAVDDLKKADGDFIFIDQSQSKNKLSTYFSNLYKYSPKNSCGSCGIVSLSQCLAYYDTVLNDDIIPEQYDKNQGNVTTMSAALSTSPGVLRQSYPTCNSHRGSTDSNDFYNFVQANRATDFQALLFDLSNISLGIDKQNYKCSTHMRNYETILSYLQADTSFNFPKISFSYIHETEYYNIQDEDMQELMKSYIKENIEKEHPVVLHLRKYSNEKYYHSVVAYECDENGDIYANFGYYQNDARVKIDFDEYYVSEAGIFDTSSVEEEHSNNYLVNNNEFCGCSAINHSHIYLSGFLPISSKNHLAFCSCGESIVTEHKFSNRLGLSNYCSMCKLFIDMEDSANE